jgi:hypothetical protein
MCKLYVAPQSGFLYSRYTRAAVSYEFMDDDVGVMSPFLSSWLKMWFGIVAGIIIAWPAGPLFVVSSFTWLWTRKRENRIAKFFSQLLLPMTLGYGTATVLVVLLHLLSVETVQRWRVWEIVVVRLRLEIHEFNQDWKILVPTVFALLVLTHFRPRLKAVTRFSRLLNILSMTYLFLASLTIFTVFSDKPLYASAEKDRWLSQQRALAALRSNYRYTARYLIVEAVRTTERSRSEKEQLTAILKSTPSISPPEQHNPPHQKHHRRTVTEEEPSLLPTPEETQYDSATKMTRELVAREFGRLSSRAELNSPDAMRTLDDLFPESLRQGSETTQQLKEEFRELPPSVEKWREQRSVAEKVESLAHNAKRMNEQSEAGLSIALSTLTGIATPDLPGLAEAFFGGLIDGLTDAVAERISRSYVTFERLPQLTNWKVNTVRTLGIKFTESMFGSEWKETFPEANPRNIILPDEVQGRLRDAEDSIAQAQEEKAEKAEKAVSWSDVWENAKSFAESIVQEITGDEEDRPPEEIKE